MLHSLLGFLLWNTIPIHVLIPQHLDFELPFLEDQNISISFTVDEKKFLDNLQEDLSGSVDTQIFSDKVMSIKEKIMFSDLFSLKFYASKLFHLKNMVLYQNNDREVKIFSKGQIKNIVFYHKDLDPILFFSDKNTIYYQFLTKNKTYLEYAEFPGLDRTLVTQPLSYKECLGMGGKVVVQKDIIICKYDDFSFHTKKINEYYDFDGNYMYNDNEFFNLRTLIDEISNPSYGGHILNLSKEAITSYVETFLIPEEKREYKTLNKKLGELGFSQNFPIIYHKGRYIQKQEDSNSAFPCILNYNEYEKSFFLQNWWDSAYEKEYSTFSISFYDKGSASDTIHLYEINGNPDIHQSISIGGKSYILQNAFIKVRSTGFDDPTEMLIGLISKRKSIGKTGKDSWEEWYQAKPLSSYEAYQDLGIFSKKAKLNFPNKSTTIRNYTITFSEYPNIEFLYRRN